jgi:hypothetical protein
MNRAAAPHVFQCMLEGLIARVVRDKSVRSINWLPLWNEDHPGVGLEHLLLAEGAADSVVLGLDEEGQAFRLAYRLTWNEAWRLREAEIALATKQQAKSLHLRTTGDGVWRDGNGREIENLRGCFDIDIWPTPFTNSFPIRREPMEVGARREFRMAWINGLDLSMHAQPQAYTRLSEHDYLFENLDGSGFSAQLTVDGDGIVLDYQGSFRRVNEGN